MIKTKRNVKIKAKFVMDNHVINSDANAEAKSNRDLHAHAKVPTNTWEKDLKGESFRRVNERVMVNKR